MHQGATPAALLVVQHSGRRHPPPAYHPLRHPAPMPHPPPRPPCPVHGCMFRPGLALCRAITHPAIGTPSSLSPSRLWGMCPSLCHVRQTGYVENPRLSSCWPCGLGRTPAMLDLNMPQRIPQATNLLVCHPCRLGRTPSRSRSSLLLLICCLVRLIVGRVHPLVELFTVIYPAEVDLVYECCGDGARWVTKTKWCGTKGAWRVPAC